jgi:hypothetical protein
MFARRIHHSEMAHKIYNYVNEDIHGDVRVFYFSALTAEAASTSNRLAFILAKALLWQTGRCADE